MTGRGRVRRGRATVITSDDITSPGGLMAAAVAFHSRHRRRGGGGGGGAVRATMGAPTDKCGGADSAPPLQTRPGTGPQPLLIDNSEYNLFVLETFLRARCSFPAWYHNDLLTGLSGIYCPFNWVYLPPSRRAQFRQMRAEVAEAATAGRSLAVELDPAGGDLKLTDVTGQPLSVELNRMLVVQHQPKGVDDAAAVVRDDDHDCLADAGNNDNATTDIPSDLLPKNDVLMSDAKVGISASVGATEDKMQQEEEAEEDGSSDIFRG